MTEAQTDGPWMGIESAPTDWTWLLCWGPDAGHGVFRLHPNTEWAEEPEYTHWMPLPPPPSSVVQELVEGNEVRVRIQNALLATLGDTYDCTRVWSAWGYGTMDDNDFVPVLDRLDELVDEIADALLTRVKGSADV